MPTLQTETHEKANIDAIAKDLDMIDKLHEAAVVRIALYHQRMTNLYNRYVKQRAFRAGELVLRRVFENMVDPTVGKFQPNWEGQYMIVRVGATASYSLNNQDGTPVPRIWNVMNLKKYYQ